jgi:hypothetical protein
MPPSSEVLPPSAPLPELPAPEAPEPEAPAPEAPEPEPEEPDPLPLELPELADGWEPLPLEEPEPMVDLPASGPDDDWLLPHAPSTVGAMEAALTRRPTPRNERDFIGYLE